MGKLVKLISPLAAMVAVAAIAAVVMTAGANQWPTTGVEAAVSSQSSSTSVTEAVAPLGNKFVRSFKFDNATKTWIFYDPRVPQHSKQKTFEPEQSYWILVTESIQVTMGGKSRNLTCVNNNCWNQMVW